MNSTPKQETTFDASTRWFHLFKDMVSSGDLARLPATAVKTYIALKSHANHATGAAFPSIETIVSTSGVSRAQVMRDLKTLMEFGYISKQKLGRSSTYTLRERVQIMDQAGTPVANASWDYVPQRVASAVADLKNVLLTGDLAGAKIVTIEKLQLNIVHQHDSAVNLNVQQMLGSLDGLPADLREKVIRAMQAQQAKKA